MEWEAEKLKHNLDIQAIPYNERLSSLLPGYVPTLAALEGIASTSAFIAFDTEYGVQPHFFISLAYSSTLDSEFSLERHLLTHVPNRSVPHCYKTTDVGLAFLPEINPTRSSRDDHPNLKKFVDKNRVEATSFKINGRYDDISNRLLSMPADHTYRTMEPLRFGKENFVDIEELDAALINRIELFRRAVPEKQLVLVGLSVQNDFWRLCLEYPGIITLFSRWIDLSTLIKAESLAPTILNTGLGTALRLLHYPRTDTGFGSRHQAANDAVRTLAALHGLLNSENVTNIVFRQSQFTGNLAGIKVKSRINHFESKVYQAFLHVDGKDLPYSIDSAQKLALAFQKFNPIGVAADCSNAKNREKRHSPSYIRSIHMTCGCVCFKSHRALQSFISATNGQKYGEVVLKVVRAVPERIQTQIRNGEVLKANRRKSRMRRAQAPESDWAESFQNIFSIESESEEEAHTHVLKEETHVLEEKAHVLEEEAHVLKDSDTTSSDHSTKRTESEKQSYWFSRFLRRKVFRKNSPIPKY
ncbi:hypothetical protein F4801DRAFT_600589 [Xylaria longipes]|nr:hypothetical protein F4801DRAFT_600589 [Xylaria longipes]RYC62257.1 hypothetical protein CHU98_g3950 [Xylaria longipes]